jgi:hypothetical protein
MPRIGEKDYSQDLERALDMVYKANAQRLQERSMELENAVRQAQLQQSRDEIDAAALNAEANYINALGQQGQITSTNLPEIQKRLPFVTGFVSVSKAERDAAAKIELEEAKIQGRMSLEEAKSKFRLGEVYAKGSVTQTVQAQKDTEAMRRAKLRATTEGAKIQISPAEFAAAGEAVEEAERPTGAPRTGTEVVEDSYFNGTITTNELINTFGSKKLIENDQLLMKALKKLETQLANPNIPDAAKEKMLDLVVGEYPEARQLFEKKGIIGRVFRAIKKK